MVFTKLDSPVDREENNPSPAAAGGGRTCCGRYCEGDPMMGREMGRSPG